MSINQYNDEMKEINREMFNLLNYIERRNKEIKLLKDLKL